jgi:hypothetical protein
MPVCIFVTLFPPVGQNRQLDEYGRRTLKITTFEMMLQLRFRFLEPNHL